MWQPLPANWTEGSILSKDTSQGWLVVSDVNRQNHTIQTRVSGAKILFLGFCFLFLFFFLIGELRKNWKPKVKGYKEGICKVEENMERLRESVQVQQSGAGL